jgi:hypothetical protein
LIVGHHDAAPWNALWRNGRLAGFVDWDTAGRHHGSSCWPTWRERSSAETLRDALTLTERRWGSRFDWYDGIFFLQIDEDPQAIAFAA